MHRSDKVFNVFKENFGLPSIALKSPGRANIIGEHTDYNDGYVFPFAIDQGIYFYAKTSALKRSKIIALDINESFEFETTDGLENYPNWFAYIKNVLSLVESKTPFEICFGGDLPLGAGVSSSSALTCGFLAVLNELFSLKMDPRDIINISSLAENGTGVEGGKMDQTTIVFGKKNHALFIDCLVQKHKYIPLNFEHQKFVLFNSGVQHKLAETAYNQRRNTCRSLLKITSEKLGISSFRNLKTSDLENIRNFINSTEWSCGQYVIEENLRVLSVVEKIKNGKEDIGEFLYASHQGLSNLYKVSCPELDLLVSLAREDDNISGARLMGGGFGGCTINLMDRHTDYSDLIRKYNKHYPGFSALEISPSQGIHLF